MQKDNAFFDAMAKFGGSAMAGVMDAKRELEALISDQIEKWAVKYGMVSREEFERVQEMVAKAREDNEILRTRLEAVELQLFGHNPK